MNDRRESIAFIVEGEVREMQIVENLISIFMPEATRSKILSLPAGKNIYALWNQLKEDDFETDIIEILRTYSDKNAAALAELTRDDFAQVYLFFDYDCQQCNLALGVDAEDVIRTMLNTLSNETDSGKLYLSYPMSEALRDTVRGQCCCFTGCALAKADISTYKEKTGKNPSFQQLKQYNYTHWVEIFHSFISRVSCLYCKRPLISFRDFRALVSPGSLYEKQLDAFICDDKVFILSAFPEFLLDYFKLGFWNKFSVSSDISTDNCPCQLGE